MKIAIYKPGGSVMVWGVMAQMKVIDSGELHEYIKDGWLDHPSKLLPVDEDNIKPRKGRKPKAVSDADKD
ncbi:hypothetical protein E4898_13205 [Salmonella enterica subsp. enterica serovar Anatum]|uniref:Uncharacterized protein n=1 Tax=Salmonella anatum TaxID=58712 RepID=A0A5Z9XSL7_SALAN|nr:hypothetical protein [Salmonella enterica]EAZ1961141.1 hypothetical protein [Salmonella enterica subsp. enterica serovar Uganda]EBG0394714.1 hypothetical protein [Salmonella enterica subsp. enterica serovar Muenster]EBH8551148.1 hypothetical protein [Salmonella enterica subsp. enterica serovar Weltevreden]EBI0021627.1 hypothetical protein [Salmonella enterica subsp. enterica serovar London]ECF3144517.1 hypothetical protein [Salmonella enterica subsp. enterica serovar Sinstorf]ECI2721078.1 